MQRGRFAPQRVPPGMVRLRNDWPSLALALFAIVAVIGACIGFGLHAVFTNKHMHQLRQRQEPIGFYAYKVGIQVVPTGVFTALIGWSVAGGSPAYDSSDGAMNLATGVWTTRIPAKYQVSASTCWTAGTVGSRQLAFVTNGNVLATPLASNLGIFVTCNSLSVTMDLAVGTTVEAQVLRSTGGVEVIIPPTGFSIERILGDS